VLYCLESLILFDIYENDLEGVVACSETSVHHTWFSATLTSGYGLNFGEISNEASKTLYKNLFQELKSPEILERHMQNQTQPLILQCKKTAYLGTFHEVRKAALKLRLFKNSNNLKIYVGKETFYKKDSGVEFKQLAEDGGIIKEPLSFLVQAGIMPNGSAL